MKLLRSLSMVAVLMGSLAQRGYAAGSHTVLILNPDLKEFNEVAAAMKERLTSEFNVASVKLKKDVDQDDFNGQIKQNKPDILILLDNTLLNFAFTYNEKAKNKLPLISAMSLNLKKVLTKDKNATGIAYEVPPFLLVTSFNNLLDKRVNKIGVIYRKGLFDWYIKEAKSQLAYEKIELIEYDIGAAEDREKTQGEIKKAFKEFKDKKADAFWLISDNAIINQKSMDILRSLSLKSGLPFLCGVKKLVSKEFNLCSYAVTPDFDTMVDQSLEQSLAILKDKLAPAEIGVEYLENVKKTLNIDLLEANLFNVKKEALEDVEVVH